MENKQYLGDGVYAELDDYGIWLRTGDHREEFCDNKIYLEPIVLSRLNNFYDPLMREQNATDNQRD